MLTIKSDKQLNEVSLIQLNDCQIDLCVNGVQVAFLFESHRGELQFNLNRDMLANLNIKY